MSCRRARAHVVAAMSVAIALLLPSSAAAAWSLGALDESFATGGIYTASQTGWSSPGDQVRGVVALGDGSTLAVAVHQWDTIALTKLRPNGTPDATFGTGGTRLLTPNPATMFNPQPVGMAIDSQGRIVIGLTSYNNSDYDLGAMRLLADGTPDATFGTGGTVVYNGGATDYARDFALNADDEPVLFGQTGPTNFTAQDILVVRFTDAGVLDTTFGGGDGVVVHDNGGNDWGLAGAVAADGSLIATCRCDGDVGVARFTSAGVLDTTFAGDGFFGPFNIGGNDVTEAALVEPGGRVLVAGLTDSTRFVYALTSAGATDTAWNGSGLRQFGGGAFYDLERLATGTIVAVGYDSNYDGTITWFNSNGSTNGAYGAGGTTTIDTGTNYEWLYTSAITPEGGLVAGGFRRPGGTDDQLVVRLSGQDVTDPTGVVSINGLTGTGSQHLRSGTVWFNPSTSGSFELTVTGSDTESGVASVTLPAAGSLGWTGGPQSTPGTSGTAVYEWGPGANDVAQSADVEDASGNSGSVPVAFTADTTAPTVAGTLTHTGGHLGSTSLDLVWDVTATDAQAGVRGVVVQRSTSPLVGDSCTSFSAYTELLRSTDLDDTQATSVTNGTCARYRIRSVDEVGNVSSTFVDSGAVAKLDLTAPTGTINALPSSFGGTVDVEGSVGDSYTDIDSVQLTWEGPGSTTGTICTGPALTGTPDASTYSCEWDTDGLGGAYTVVLDVEDVAGNTFQATRSVFIDNTAPTASVSSVDVSAASGFAHWTGSVLWFNPAQAGSVTVRLTAGDGAGSGIASATFPDPDGGASGWTVTGSPDTSAPYAATYTWAAGATDPGALSIVVVDNAGNGATAGLSIDADALAPTGDPIEATNGVRSTLSASVDYVHASFSDASSGLAVAKLYRSTGALAHGTCSGYGAYAFLDDLDPLGTTYTDSTVTHGTCVRYQAFLTDRVGNVSAALADGSVARIDTAAPTGAIDALAAPVVGAVDVTGTAVDASTAVGAMSLKWRGPAASTGTICTNPPLAGAPSAATYTCRWDTSALAQGAYVVTLELVDSAGNDTEVSRQVLVDNTPPVASVASVAAGAAAHWTGAALWYDPTRAGSFTVALDANDGTGSGVASATFPDPDGSGSGWTVTGSPDTSAPYSATYAWTAGAADPAPIAVVVVDGGGNSATTTLTVDADTVAPTVAVDAIAAGEGRDAQVSSTADGVRFRPGSTGSFDVTVTAGDGTGSGVDRVEFADPDGPAGAWTVTPRVDSVAPRRVSATYRWTAAATAPAAPVAVTTFDNTGRTGATSFAVTGDGAGPAGGSIGYASGAQRARAATVTFAVGADALTGVAGWTIERRSAPLRTTGGCGTYGAFAPVGGASPASPLADAALAAGACHAWRLVAVDGVGNRSVFESAAEYRVPAGRGTARADLLVGDTTADRIEGLAGNDRLFGVGGDDTLLGGPGNDALDGGAGNDTITDRQGGDTVVGGAGNDRIDVRDMRGTAAGRDVVRCGPGRDTVVANANDQVARDCERVTRR